MSNKNQLMLTAIASYQRGLCLSCCNCTTKTVSPLQTELVQQPQTVSWQRIANGRRSKCQCRGATYQVEIINCFRNREIHVYRDSKLASHYGMNHSRPIVRLFSGKWWGPRTKQPILALHGWQDNAGTFDTLAPLLPHHIPLFCIDLPGHGAS